jgi:hypothetical protein
MNDDHHGRQRVLLDLMTRTRWLSWSAEAVNKRRRFASFNPLFTLWFIGNKERSNHRFRLLSAPTRRSRGIGCLPVTLRVIAATSRLSLIAPLSPPTDPLHPLHPTKRSIQVVGPGRPSIPAAVALGASRIGRGKFASLRLRKPFGRPPPNARDDRLGIIAWIEFRDSTCT